MEPWIVLVIILSALLVLLLLFFLRSEYERRHPVLKEYTVESAKVPEAFSGYRIAYLSDLHGENPGKALERAEALLRNCGADLVLLGGDMLTVPRSGHGTYDAKPLEKLLSAVPEGVSVIFSDGNHEVRMRENPDRYPGWTERFSKLLEEYHVTRLQNRRTEISREGSRILISDAALPEETYLQKFRKKKLPAGYFRRVLGEKPEGFEVMLLHSPQYMREACEYGAGLVLSGHFHGGTIRLFGIGLMTPQFQLLNRFCHGLYRFPDGAGIAGAGLGTHTINIRFMNRPEIVLVTLTKI